MVKIKMNGKIYQFETAVTSEEKEKGLMFRKSLAKDSGMLFVYQKEEYMSYWMKNTLIPLDIAFIDRDFRITDIHSMKPLDETPVSSKAKAMYALEVNPGFFQRAGVKEGDVIELVTSIPYVD
jgi:hypothetical protein